MKINLTDIRETKKGRMALFFDGEFIFSVLPEMLFEYHLIIGEEYDTEYIAGVQKASEKKDAKRKGYHYLSYRSYSQRALLDKLTQKFSAEAAAEAVAEIAEMGYLDDEDYARRLAGDLYNLKRRSVRRIRQEMQKRGLERELVDRVLDEESFDDRETLFNLVERKYRSKLAAEAGGQKVAASLARLGFSWEDIKYVLREFEDED